LECNSQVEWDFHTERLMNDLATLTGQPRPCLIADRRWRLYPLTLRDLGRYQAWLDATAPDPAQLIATDLAHFSGAARRYLESAGKVIADRERPLLGMVQADELFLTLGSLAELLRLSIGRGERIGRARATELARQLDAGGIAVLRWAMWGERPDAATAADDEDESVPAIINWWEIINELTHYPHIHTLESVLRMTVPQFRCVRSNGKLPGQRKLENAADYMEHMRRLESDPWFH
jgi:hypothetical protein